MYAAVSYLQMRNPWGEAGIYPVCCILYRFVCVYIVFTDEESLGERLESVLPVKDKIRTRFSKYMYLMAFYPPPFQLLF